VAKDVLTQLQKYLNNKHSFDMSDYTEHVPPVQPQKNNYDCGFHVLLYIEEFMKEKMYKINRGQDYPWAPLSGQRLNLKYTS